VEITSPTSLPTYLTSSTTVVLAGRAIDSDGVTAMSWAFDFGASGNVAFTTAPGAGFPIWNIPGLPLEPGANVITVTAANAAEAAGTGALIGHRDTFGCTGFAAADSGSTAHSGPALKSLAALLGR
jgi:hypothetical protein